jgi:hypothetical protein
LSEVEWENFYFSLQFFIIWKLFYEFIFVIKFFPSQFNQRTRKFFIARFPELTFRNVHAFGSWLLLLRMRFWLKRRLHGNMHPCPSLSLALDFLKKSWRETPKKKIGTCIDTLIKGVTLERENYTHGISLRERFSFLFISVTKRIAIENHTWNHEHARTRTLLVPSGYSWLTINWFYFSFIIVHTK